MKALRPTFVYPIGNGYSNMDTYQCVVSKLDIREFNTQEVEAEIKLKVLDAARLTGTGMNLQHWRFILVEDKTNLNLLAQDSTSGAWIASADFAIIILTNPKYHFHLIDAGRAAQSMQLTAWSQGVGSGLFTGMREEELRSDFKIPNDLTPSIVLGFGYPLKMLTGQRKNRLSLSQLVYKEQYGRP